MMAGARLTGTDGGSSHLDGTENGHSPLCFDKAEHRAAGTDLAKAMCKDNDAAHENVARTRMGGGEGSGEQSDAFRSQAPEGAGDETGTTRWAETALISAEIRGADNDGRANIALVRVASEKAGEASGEMGAMRNIEMVAHAAHGNKRVPSQNPMPSLYDPPRHAG